MQETIYEKYIQDVYDSCKNVANPTTGGLLIGSVCGGYTPAQCTPKRFFDFMGNSANHYAPFDIVFNVVNDSTNAINHTAIPCDQAYVNYIQSV